MTISYQMVQNINFTHRPYQIQTYIYIYKISKWYASGLIGFEITFMKLITSKIYYKYSEILTNALRTLVYELFLEIFYGKMIK